jgi:hypothetical protein
MVSQVIVALAAALSGTGELAGESPQTGELPSHQVVAIYFHRTVRCPTCKRIGALAEEAVVEGFAKDIEAGTVEFRFVDFQDKKNAAIAKAYKIENPTLVLTNVFDGKVVRWAPMPKVWPLAGKPAELQAYVQEGVAKYLSQSKTEAESDE